MTGVGRVAHVPIDIPRPCHPERSGAESKDLRFVFWRKGGKPSHCLWVGSIITKGLRPDLSRGYTVPMKSTTLRALPLVAGVLLLPLAAATLHAQDWAKARLEASPRHREGRRVQERD